jgi:hypothetical protein
MESFYALPYESLGFSPWGEFILIIMGKLNFEFEVSESGAKIRCQIDTSYDNLRYE